MSRRAQATALLLFGVMLAVTAASWSAATPSTQFTVHWGVSGAADGYAGREALLLVPGLALVVAALVRLAVRFDPRRENIVRSASAVDTMVLALVLSLLLVQAAIASSGSGTVLPMDRLAPVAIGALILIIGRVLPQIRQNYTVGVRLPWTIESEKSWDATHALAGRIWVAVGAATIVSGVVTGGALPIVLLLVGLIGSLPIVARRAYRTWKYDRRR